jgi:hypothetical protein
VARGRDVSSLSLAFASWEVGMRERERVWWNDGFVRRTEGDELFGFGLYRVSRIVQRKRGTSQAHPVLQRESGISILGILALVLVRLAGA